MKPQQDIVGLIGYGRSGKDTVASMMPYRRFAFADKVRETVRLLDPYITLPYQTRPSRRLSHWLAAGISEDELKTQTNYRDELVKVGRGFRDLFGSHFWINLILEDMEYLPPYSKSVITDVRYPNEVEALGEVGGRFFYLDRPGYGPSNLEEEASIDDILRIYGGSITRLPNTAGLVELRQTVKDLVLSTIRC